MASRSVGLLRDSPQRPGLLLRKRLRAKKLWPGSGVESSLVHHRVIEFSRLQSSHACWGSIAPLAISLALVGAIVTEISINNVGF